MSFLTQALGALTGTLPNVLDRVVDRVLPDKLTEAEKADLKRQLADAAHERELELQAIALQADAEFNKRIRDLEGTAKDLKTLPIAGPVLIFLRGAFRPLFSYAALFWDWKVLSGAWEKPDPELFFAINVLVLGFYFGERAMQNVLPALNRFLERKNGNR